MNSASLTEHHGINSRRRTRPVLDKSQQARRGRLPAFTLIELLVVVAVLAILIAVLLPALGGARQATLRSASASNQRQLGVMLAAYAGDHQDRVPLGFSLGPGEGWKQYNYLLRTNPTSGRASMRWMGLLYEYGMLESPEAFYCPAEQDPLMQFDTENNPWPPDETAPLGKSTRVGYGTRPMIGWPFPSDRPRPRGMPRLSDLRPGAAILADLIHKPERLDVRHQNGINATRSDGSVAWRDRTILDRVEVDGITWADTADTGFDTAFNDLMLSTEPDTDRPRGLWAAIDQN